MKPDPALIPASLTFLVLIAGAVWFWIQDQTRRRQNNQAYEARKLRVLVAHVLDQPSPVQLEAVQLFAECEQWGWNLDALDEERFPELSKRI